MGKLTDFITSREEEYQRIATHNPFEEGGEIKQLFLEQVENLDFFKCKVKNEDKSFYLLKFRLDENPLKIKSPSENPYEFRVIDATHIEYDSVVYDITDIEDWDSEDEDLIANLYEYLSFEFQPKSTLTDGKEYIENPENVFKEI